MEILIVIIIGNEIYHTCHNQNLFLNFCPV